MDNHGDIYYIEVIKSITATLSFVSYIHKRLDQKHGFHPSFIDENIRVLCVMKSNVQTLYHLHIREVGRKTRRDWLENIKYHDHYPVDLSWCCFCHHSRCVLEEARMK